MDHGREAARPTTVESTNLSMIGAVQEGEENRSSGTFHGHLDAAAAQRAGIDGFQPSAVAYHGSTVFARQVRSVPVAVFGHQPSPVGGVLVGLQLPGGVMPVHDDNYGYSELQPRPGAGHGVVLGNLLPGCGSGGVHNGDHALQLRPGAGHGEELVNQLPDGARHGEVFVGLLPGGVDAAYDNYAYYALQPHPGARHGEVLVDLVPDGAGHGEVFVGLLPGGVDAVYDNYGYTALQPRPDAGHGQVLVDLLPDGTGYGEVLLGPLPSGVGAVVDNSGDFAQQTPLGTGSADGIAGALRDPNLRAGYDGSVALADDLGAVYSNHRGMVSEHLRRLLPLVGIGASSVAINGLAASPGSPFVVFHLFALLLGGLFLVTQHVLRV